ncbi:MarR family winged helix-turn-helix transcriptional regulator [Oceaniovalibus sp. ACAM 378]|uniref:MarR family winged helix-turn-helix transcriptional regulator n=1 Tax=Oceaniovalibus sp. ACAM 378 TaxID=2599923 RepID=UPI0011D5A7F1|nr:MarR family transcriptional regulator [Oceaniovalibus sp. ACAM 378]TYB88565.1 MarR family transcriptional regulator [Oceaniovalibus sp. ACAM 378]
MTYVLDEQVGYILRQVSQRHGLIFQAHAPAGLTPTQFSALVRLDQLGPLSQNELGRATAMDVATIKGVVDRLRAKGLVALSAYPGDKRRNRINLTAQSQAMISNLHEAGETITGETLSALSPEDSATLVALLTRLI